MKKIWTLFLLLLMFTTTEAQIAVKVGVIDTTDVDIKTAIEFYKSYLNEFKGKHLPSYSNYWSKNDCDRFKVPDPIVYSISSDYPTYKFGKQKTIFYVRKESEYVHIKTLLTQQDSLKQIILFAITNHYVALHDSTNKTHFISPLTLNSNLFKTVVNDNITYHFPVEHKFNWKKSNNLLNRLRKIEKDWNFQKIHFDYYFADNTNKIAMLKGLDYYYGMEQTTPSGMTFPDEKIIFCNGYDESYLHEVLHIYFNPQYGKSPINHGLIYYLAGGLGHDFNWMINRMNAYLEKYPETDLSQFESLQTKDIMLHLDHTVIGLICKIVDEKEGVKGLQRLLEYSSIDELFLNEFHLQKNSWDGFLKQNFRDYNNKN